MWDPIHIVCSSQRCFNFLQLEHRTSSLLRFFVMYLLNFFFLIALNFDNQIGWQTTCKHAFSPTACTSNNIAFHILSQKPSPQLFCWLQLCVFCATSHQQGYNNGCQGSSCLPCCFPRFLWNQMTGVVAFLGISRLFIQFLFWHTVNGVSCRTTYVDGFKGDDLETRLVHKYRPKDI